MLVLSVNSWHESHGRVMQQRGMLQLGEPLETGAGRSGSGSIESGLRGRMGGCCGQECGKCCSGYDVRKMQSVSWE